MTWDFRPWVACASFMYVCEDLRVKKSRELWMPNLNSCFFLLLLIPLLRFCWILVPGALSYTRPTNNQPLCCLVFHAMILRLCQGRRPRWLQGDISSLALLVQWGQTQRRALRRIIRSPQTGRLYYWNQRMSWTQSHRPVGHLFLDVFRYLVIYLVQFLCPDFF